VVLNRLNETHITDATLSHFCTGFSGEIFQSFVSGISAQLRRQNVGIVDEILMKLLKLLTYSGKYELSARDKHYRRTEHVPRVQDMTAHNHQQSLSSTKLVVGCECQVGIVVYTYPDVGVSQHWRTTCSSEIDTAPKNYHPDVFIIITMNRVGIVL
jgi:hypothetical protein